MSKWLIKYGEVRFFCRMNFHHSMEHVFDPYTKKKIVGYLDEPARKTPIIEETDVLVVGGSPSGVAAAVSAARNGAKVRLVERFGFLGGQSVYGSVTQWEMRAYINKQGAVTTRGIAKEMVDRIVARGHSDGLWNTPYVFPEMRDGEEWLDPIDIKLVLTEMCEEAGVELLFHTLAVDSIVERNQKSDKPKLTGVIFENKTGRFVIKAKIVIDATADLDLVWRAIGEEGCRLRPPEQRIGAGFYVYYGNVDTEKFVKWAIEQPDTKGYPYFEKSHDKILEHLREQKLIMLRGFSQVMEKAEELGYFDEVEEILEPLGIATFIDLGMKWVGYDRWCLSIMEVPNLNLLDTWQLTKFEIARLKMEAVALKVLKLMPGWEKAIIDRDNLVIGSRETRILKGEYTLTKDDIFNPDHDRKDAIGRSGGHDPGKNKLKKAYPIPYGIIVPKNLDGTLVCTRAVSAETPLPLNAHRGITPTIVVGQGAGTAAAICVKHNIEPRDVDLSELRDLLRKADVVLDVETIELDITPEKPKWNR